MVLQKWENLVAGDKHDRATVLAVQALYKAAIEHCKGSPSRDELCGTLQVRLEAFNAQPAVASVMARTRSRVSGSDAQVGPRVKAFTRFVVGVGERDMWEEGHTTHDAWSLWVVVVSFVGADLWRANASLWPT